MLKKTITLRNILYYLIILENYNNLKNRAILNKQFLFSKFSKKFL